MSRCTFKNPIHSCRPKTFLLTPWRNDIVCETLSRFASVNLPYKKLRTIQNRLPIVYPWDKDYNCSRQSYNRKFNYYPLGIIYCKTSKHVQRALKFCLRYTLEFSIRSSGHHYLNYSVSTGIVIDLSKMNRIHVCSPSKESKELASDIRSNRLVEVGPGTRLGVLQTKLSKYKIAVPVGSCKDTSVSLAQGGGISPSLMRLSGLLCDHLYSADVVLANGAQITVSKKQHFDLFWALQGGGGGAFGIVTKFVFQPCPFRGCILFRLTFPWEEMEYVLIQWQNTAPFCDKRLSSELELRSPKFFPDSSVEFKGQFEGTQNEFELVFQRDFPWLSHVQVIRKNSKVFPL